MNNDFWINIKKSGAFYEIEMWTTDESRILYLEKKKVLFKWWANRSARKWIIKKISNQFINYK